MTTTIHPLDAIRNQLIKCYHDEPSSKPTWNQLANFIRSCNPGRNLTNPKVQRAIVIISQNPNLQGIPSLSTDSKTFSFGGISFSARKPPTFGGKRKRRPQPLSIETTPTNMFSQETTPTQSPSPTPAPKRKKRKPTLKMASIHTALRSGLSNDHAASLGIDDAKLLLAADSAQINRAIDLGIYYRNQRMNKAKNHEVISTSHVHENYGQTLKSMNIGHGAYNYDVQFDDFHLQGFNSVGRFLSAVQNTPDEIKTPSDKHSFPSWSLDCGKDDHRSVIAFCVARSAFILKEKQMGMTSDIMENDYMPY